jgi:hypothetical protein
LSSVRITGKLTQTERLSGREVKVQARYIARWAGDFLGSGHILDEGFFERGLGLKFLVQIGDEIQKAIRGLAFENDGAGEQTVLLGVAGRGALALRSGRAAGFGSVGARSLFLTFGAHGNKRAHEMGDGGELGGSFVDLRGNINILSAATE